MTLTAVQIVVLALSACAVLLLTMAVRWTRRAARDQQQAALLLASTRRPRRASQRR